VTRDVEDLFTDAAETLARTTRRYPVNISSINDIMRQKDRWVGEFRAEGVGVMGW
jgi:hypothetical protein